VGNRGSFREAMTTLTSRLDSPFLRALRDIVGAARLPPTTLEQLVQQQLVHGGVLDTLVLELGVATEAEVTRALAVANDTAPVDGAVLAAPKDDAVRRLPARMATAMGLLPLFVDEDGGQATLHVACASPVDDALCAELASLLPLRVVAHAVPEVRLRVGLHRAFGAPLSGRFVALRRLLDGAATNGRAAGTDSATGDATGDAAGATVGDARVHGASATAGSPAARPPQADDHGGDAATWDLVEALANLAAQDGREGIARVAVAYARRFLPFAALFGVRDGTLFGWRRSGLAEGALFPAQPLRLPAGVLLAPVLSSAAPFLGRVPVSPANDAFLGWLGRPRPRTALVLPVSVGGRVVAALWADGGPRERAAAELGELVAFGARLGSAFEALLRQRQRQHPSLFPTPSSSSPPTPATAMAPPSAQALPPRPSATTAPLPVGDDGGQPGVDDNATTPVAPAEPATASLLAPPRVVRTSTLDGTSPFARRLTSAAPLVAEDGVEAGLLLARPLPTRGPTARVDVVDIPVPALFRLDDDAAPDAWQAALRRTIASDLAGDAVDDSDPWWPVDREAPAATAATAATTTKATASPLAGLFDGVDRTSPTASTPGSLPASAPLSVPPALAARAPTAVALVERLFGDDEGDVATAAQALYARGAAALPALTERFPGRLRINPLDGSPAGAAVGDWGPLLGVLARLGRPGLEAALEHLESRQAPHRCAAVALFVAVPDVRAVDVLLPRLYDADARVRALAVEAIAPWSGHKRFERLLARLRERVLTERMVATESRRRAVELLGVFRDVGAVPLLIEQLRGPLGAAASLSLRAITLQDHGPQARPWRRWWGSAKKRSRVDWLIAALDSDDAALRRMACEDLRGAVGADFGYRPDGDAAERARAAQEWQHWWMAEQKTLTEAR